MIWDVEMVKEILSGKTCKPRTLMILMTGYYMVLDFVSSFFRTSHFNGKSLQSTHG